MPIALQALITPGADIREAAIPKLVDLAQHFGVTVYAESEGGLSIHARPIDTVELLQLAWDRLRPESAIISTAIPHPIRPEVEVEADAAILAELPKACALLDRAGKSIPLTVGGLIQLLGRLDPSMPIAIAGANGLRRAKSIELEWAKVDPVTGDVFEVTIFPTGDHQVIARLAR